MAGDLVYLAGMLPADAGGRVVAGDVRAQTARVLDNLAALLKQNGSRMEQVAAVTVYLKNQADFAAMNEVYGKYWLCLGSEGSEGAPTASDSGRYVTSSSHRGTYRVQG